MAIREWWLREWNDQQPDGFLSGNVEITPAYDVYDKPEKDTIQVIDATGMPSKEEIRLALDHLQDAVLDKPCGPKGQAAWDHLCLWLRLLAAE